MDRHLRRGLNAHCVRWRAASRRAYTACGEGAIVIGGNKHQPYEITVTAIYTETATTEAFDFIHDRFMGTAKRWPCAGHRKAESRRLSETRFSTPRSAGRQSQPMLKCCGAYLRRMRAAQTGSVRVAVRSPLIYESVSATNEMVTIPQSQ